MNVSWRGSSLKHIGLQARSASFSILQTVNHNVVALTVTVYSSLSGSQYWQGFRIACGSATRLFNDLQLLLL